MKFIKSLILWIIFIVIVIVGIFTYLGYQKFEEVLNEGSIEEKIAEIESKKSYITIDELPKIYLDAVVAVEDHRFYEHGPVDIVSIGRAVFTNFKQKDLVEGGSTITQQIAKNIFFNQDRDILRKIAEIFMAIEIEKVYSKDKVLELYVNTSYFGDGYYGINSACKGYYEKEPKDMTLYEATLLAGVPNAPSIYAPTNSLKLAEQRQNQVVNAMLAYGKLTKEQADSIENDKQYVENNK